MRRMLIVAAAVVCGLAGGTTTAQGVWIYWLTPTSIPPVTGPSSTTVTATGYGYMPGVSQVYANGQPVPTTVTNPFTLTFQVANTIPQASLDGALVIAVTNTYGFESNRVALPIEVSPGVIGSNQGTPSFFPLGSTPGQSVQFLLDGVQVGVPLTLMVDTATPPPIFPLLSVPGDLVLGVVPGAATFFTIVDGLGLFGPADPNGHTSNSTGFPPPGGFFSMPGFTLPNPPLGVSMSIQAVYTDPTSPFGWRLSWTLFPFTL